jgi:hypothetical protein
VGGLTGKTRRGEMEEDLEFVEAELKGRILVMKLDFLGILKTKREFLTRLGRICCFEGKVALKVETGMECTT